MNDAGRTSRESGSERFAPVLNAEAPLVLSEQAESMLPAELILDDETVILLFRPSLMYIALSSFGSLVFIALITFVLAWMQRLPWFNWNDTLAFSFGAALAVVRLSWQTLEWYSRVYVLTDRRIIRRMGVLRVAIFETQLKNIQHTSVFQSVRERMFGLGTIGFATAGSDVFEAYWVMASKPFEKHRIVVKAIEKYGK